MRIVLLNRNMFLLTSMVLSKGSLKCPESLFHDIFILYFWYAFFLKDRSKKSREKSYSRINRFLSWFFNIKKFYSWKSLVKSSLHDQNRTAFIVKSFLPEIISRSQLPQNTLNSLLFTSCLPFEIWIAFGTVTFHVWHFIISCRSP